MMAELDTAKDAPRHNDEHSNGCDGRSVYHIRPSLGRNTAPPRAWTDSLTPNMARVGRKPGRPAGSAALGLGTAKILAAYDCGRNEGIVELAPAVTPAASSRAGGREHTGQCFLGF
jgi:hypothetical protein